MRYFWLIGTAFLLAGCNPGLGVLSMNDAEPLVIRTGTSFGHCLGYCTTTVEIEGTEAVLTRESRDPSNPPLTHSLAIPQAEWERLVALADAEAFARLDEVYGCPDCADGGAEWIEVERAGEVRRVTFEHGATVEGIAPLIRELREIRERFPPAP